ncbi:hypothetical protein RDWZM_005860 [Blomia tropicalis]|uniref:Cyclin-dependent kinase inhibitor domain-containing protein n=1 Tax=Blomia tropicalis TaxID=40697 RepID=A0A9Q0M7J6_BLOTA|nr:hypothetical protein RDWZM_005860 [Blomia tropicalis]
MTISDISGSSAWSSDNWHYSSKRSTSSTMYHPMNHINNNRNDDLQYKSSSNRQVSRSLFGPSDPLESRRIAREVLSSQRFNDKNRWNFDFYHEKPIPGRFEWNKSNTIGKDLSGAKKYSSGDDLSCMDVKRNMSSSWTSSKHDESAFRDKSRSPESKRKY